MSSYMGYFKGKPIGRAGMVFVVSCKRCARAIPAGVEAWAKDNLVVACPLCGELRRYRPSEIYLGLLDSRLADQRASLRNHNPASRRRPHHPRQ